MLTNPFLNTPQSAGWAMGFAFGFSSEPQSVPPPLVIAPELTDAFDDGALVGQEAAAEGFEFAAARVDTSEPHSLGSMVFHSASPAVEIAHGIWDLRTLASVAAGVGSVIVGLIELSIALPTDVSAPEEVLSSLGRQLLVKLNEIGVPTLELFCGAAFDPASAGSPISVTRAFRSFEPARDAVLALGCDAWIVVRWRTDTSDVFDIIDGADAA